MRTLLLLLILSCLVLSCERSNDQGSLPGHKESSLPSWTDEQGGLFEKGDLKLFTGNGSAAGISNGSLLRSTADNRARSNLSLIVREYTRMILGEYKREISEADKERIKMISGKGIEIVDHWQDRKTGKLYAKAQLDLAMYKQFVKTDPDLSLPVREHILQNADRYYAQLLHKNEQR